MIVIVALAVLPVPVIYLFYHRYFVVKPNHLYHLEYFLYGSVLALLMLLASSFITRHLAFDSAIAMGFLGAAMIEKAGAFVLLAVLMYRSPPIIMALNLVISAMLLGLGFATVENIMYAMAIRDPVIIVRLLSSVPLHVLTCGLIGYGLSLARLSGSTARKAWLGLMALAVPFFFHGLYDTLLIGGGTGTYWIAPLIVILVIAVEYLLARSQTLPLLDGLRKHDMSLEDWVTVQREPQYERWILRSMGSRNREYVPLFRLNIGRVRAAVITVTALGALAALLQREAIIAALGQRLNMEETVMLFTLLPLLYSLNLLAIGVINPKYFQYSIIKIPLIIDVDINAPGSTIKTITYHVTGGNCYLKTVDPLGTGTQLALVFTCPRFSSPPVPGMVLWDSHDEQKQLSGTLVRFGRRPIGYWLFLARYTLYRVTRGLSFNLRLPGFRSVRQLFVRPVSVMQKEWRYGPGQRLFEQGDEGKYFYLIRKGEVDIVKTLETGEQVLMTTLKEGDIFGEMAIVGNQPRLATAICRTDCLLAVAEADNLDALIDGNPVFTQMLIKNFANRLHSSEKIMLKSMADIEGASRRREKSLRALCALLLAVSGIDRGDHAALEKTDAAQLAKRLNMDPGTVRVMIARMLLALEETRTADEALEHVLKDL
jgi:protease PrsW